MIPAANDWLRVAWTQAWQVTVLILAVALFLRCASRNRPQLASVLWLVVFLKCITPPVWSSPGGVFCWLQPPQSTHHKNSQNTLAVVVLPADAADVSSHAESIRPLPDSGEQTLESGFDIACLAVWITAVWIGGTMVLFGAFAARWRRLARLLRQADNRTDPRWNTVLNNLTHRLKIPWRMRLVVTRHPVGPAVFGLLRPTIILPKSVIEGKSTEQIELILAHELIHVRRGDLWFAHLRSLVLSVWWFHPLVWWAGRKASREAERCCDEAVLVELRCSPARYARCLLDILEIKHRLATVPAFPGVRAIEVTQGRLERIMKIGQKGLRRTPWWCWGAALVAAVAALPGAALVIAADEGSQAPYQAIPQGLTAHPLDAYAAPTGSTPAAPPLGAALASGGNKTQSDAVYVKTYSVEDVLSKIQKERGLSKSAAKDFLKEHADHPGVTPVLCGSQRHDPIVVNWLGDQLVVGGTAEQHQRLEKSLEAFRKFGAEEIIVEVRFMTLNNTLLQEFLPESTISPMNVAESDLDDAVADAAAVQPASFNSPSDSRDGTHINRAQLLIEKDSPVRIRTIEKDQGEKLIARCQEDKRSNVIQAPKVKVFSGQTALVSDTSQSPFVVGVSPVVGPYATAYRPQIRVVSEGTTLQLRPVSDRSGEVRLDFTASFSKIQEVGTATFNRTPAGGTTVQMPKVATIRLEGGATLKPGQWLLFSGSDITDQMTETQVKADWPVSWFDKFVGGRKHQEPHETYSLIMMLRAEKLAADPQDVESNAKPGSP